MSAPASPNLPPTSAEQMTLAADSPGSAPAELSRGGANWISSVRLIGLWTLLSRVLGLLRDIGMAAVFGNGPLLDSFTLAFRIPNLSRRLFGEGALTTAFLPEFVKTHRRDTAQAQQLASSVFVWLGLFLVLLVLLGELLLWGLVALFPLSNSRDMYLMTAWMLPYVVLICLSAQLGAILNALGKFGMPALVPVVMNLVWIAALWLFVPGQADDWGKIQIVMGAVLIGGVLQLILPAVSLYRLGFRFSPDWRSQWPATRRVFLLMFPIVMGLSIPQLNAMCDSSLAWWYSQPEQGVWVNPGTASALYFGQRMYQFPLGVFGVALGTVLFARLAGHAEAGRNERVAEETLLGLRLTFLVGAPATVGLMLLAEPITDCLLKRGNFDQDDVVQTSAAVFAYSTGIWAYLGVSLIQRVFYAVEDARTPFRVGLIVVSLNVALNFLFLFTVGGTGLAYATSLSAIVQFILLIALLRGRIGLTFPRQFWLFSGLILLATFFMWLICLSIDEFWSPQTRTGEWAKLGTLIATCLLTYGCLLKAFRVNELDLLFRSSRSKPTPPRSIDPAN